jgi:hypothetical protein
MIEALATEDPPLYAAFLDDRRAAEGESHLVRNSGRYPLTGRGDINTYAIFAETNRMVLGPTGRVGMIVPSGIATDDTTKFFFQDLMDSRSLVSLYDFENRDGIFPGVHRSYKFCLLTLAGAERPSNVGAEFVFFALSASDLRDEERRFTLSGADLALLNPNTHTCPIFRSSRDAELTKAIYRRVPVLIRDGPPEENTWGVRFATLFHMTNDADSFRTRDELEMAGWRLHGNIFERDEERYLPLWEGRMIDHFDHRVASVGVSAAATIRTSTTLETSASEHNDPFFYASPRSWVSSSKTVDAILGDYDRDWFIGMKDITSATNARTVVATTIPRTAVGNTIALVLPDRESLTMAGLLAANLSSYVLDFVARVKVGGLHLNFFIVNQFSILPPNAYRWPCQWSLDERLSDWLLARVLELTYTAWDLQPFARDCGYDGPPFRWDEARRFLLRCELDAAFFHLYAIARDDVAYIMDTFPIVRRKDEATHGEYRTKRVILELYDAMAAARADGLPYQTRLDPPPADPRVAHPLPRSAPA